MWPSFHHLIEWTLMMSRIIIILIFFTFWSYKMWEHRILTFFLCEIVAPYSLLFVNLYIAWHRKTNANLKPHHTNMWIKSHYLSTIRWRIVSPLGYQSPTLGDSVPVPGPQEAQCVTLQPGVTTSTLSCIPWLFASIVSSARTRWEANSRYWISGQCRLHQDEVIECLTMEETWQVSP